jgi:hypothetical protein
MQWIWRLGADLAWKNHETLPIHLTSGQDLRTALKGAAYTQNCRAPFAVSRGDCHFYVNQVYSVFAIQEYRI